MNTLTKDLGNNLVLNDPKNPLSAMDKWNKKSVYKFSYHPKKGRLLYCYPGQFHIDAISKAGDKDIFDEYVRIIYDPSKNVAGSRVWGDADYFNNSPDTDAKSFKAQYAAFKFFIKFDPNLKWILNLTNKDLTSNEALNSSRIFKNRILKNTQMEELRKNFKKIYENEKLNEYWGIQRMVNR